MLQSHVRAFDQSIGRELGIAMVASVAPIVGTADCNNVVAAADHGHRAATSIGHQILSTLRLEPKSTARRRVC
jgi:hypothetical protein